MNTVSVVKKVFHILTVASTSLAAVPNGILTGKAAIYVAIATSGISFALHILTTIYPDVAAAEGK